MPLIREKIKYLPIFSSGQTININFGLTSSDNLLGYQQEIDNLTQVTSLDLVNPPLDVEERKIKYEPNIGPTTLQFNFHVSNGGNLWISSFLAAGFNYNDISGLTPSMLNSFFIVDYYDTYDINTQTKIFTTYLTKLIDINNSYIPTYTIDVGVLNQLYYWYVPIWYLNAQTGTTVTGYTKFTFYNAKSGTTALFFNPDNDAPVGEYINPEKMYFRSEININNKTWKIITPSTHHNVVIANQLWDNPQYNQKIDNSIVNFNNEAQNYPSGSTFIYSLGKYVVT
jgi:hypothetical protein